VDVSSPAGFKLPHSRPGTVSLSIAGDNDEDPAVKDRGAYRCAVCAGVGAVWGQSEMSLIMRMRTTH
jgi:hypothetical protein